MLDKILQAINNFSFPEDKYKKALEPNWFESKEDCPNCGAPLMMKIEPVADWLEYHLKCEYCRYTYDED